MHPSLPAGITFANNFCFNFQCIYLKCLCVSILYFSCKPDLFKSTCSVYIPFLIRMVRLIRKCCPRLNLGQNNLECVYVGVFSIKRSLLFVKKLGNPTGDTLCITLNIGCTCKKSKPSRVVFYNSLCHTCGD